MPAAFRADHSRTYYRDRMLCPIGHGIDAGLTDLAQAVLSLARAGDPAGVTLASNMDLRDVLDDAIDLLRPILRQRGIWLTYRAPPVALHILANRPTLSLLLPCLLKDSLSLCAGQRSHLTLSAHVTDAVTLTLCSEEVSTHKRPGTLSEYPARLSQLGGTLTFPAAPSATLFWLSFPVDGTGPDQHPTFRASRPDVLPGLSRA
ncbi:MAG: hypothetical protein AAFY65_09860 [Pseudomonadota bacterium]